MINTMSILSNLLSRSGWVLEHTGLGNTSDGMPVCTTIELKQSKIKFARSNSFKQNTLPRDSDTEVSTSGRTDSDVTTIQGWEETIERMGGASLEDTVFSPCAANQFRDVFLDYASFNQVADGQTFEECIFHYI